MTILWFRSTAYPCQFPTELSGNWLSSRKGAVTLTATELRGLFTCTSPTCSANLDTLECYRTDNNKYLLRLESSSLPFLSAFIPVHLLRRRRRRLFIPIDWTLKPQQCTYVICISAKIPACLSTYRSSVRLFVFLSAYLSVCLYVLLVVLICICISVYLLLTPDLI